MRSGVCLVLIALGLPAAQEPKFALLAAQEPKSGEWIDLLAGDLNKHWSTKGNWLLAADGIAALKPREGEKGWSRFHMYLWSREKFNDFECEFDYQFERGGNSGFFLRVADMANPVQTGLEVQLRDPPDSPPTQLADHMVGGVIPGFPPKKLAAKSAGEWNSMRVTTRGNRLTVELNGDVVNEVNLEVPAVANRPREGWIGFQDHGQPIKLRNVRIRKLN